MKHFLNVLSISFVILSFLLSLFFALSGKTGDSLGFASVLFIISLVFLGYQQYLAKIEQPDLKKELDELRLTMVKAHTKHKEETEKSFIKIQDEMGKISLAVGSKAPAAIKTANDKKIIF